MSTKPFEGIKSCGIVVLPMLKERGAITIYALIAELKSGLSTYIGHSVNFDRRMREHCKMREGKAATLLIQQAEAEGRAVRVIILETAESVDQAESAEGAWIWRAQERGINLIALDTWFQRKNSTHHLAASKIWPDSSTLALTARPLLEFSKHFLVREKALRMSIRSLEE